MKDLFTFENHPVRIHQEPNGEILWCAIDVATSLGYTDPQRAVSTHVDDEFATIRAIQTTGGVRQVKFLMEPALYQLIGSSTKPEAKKFTRWAITEVFPALRKTGQYTMSWREEQDTLYHANKILQNLANHSKKLALTPEELTSAIEESLFEATGKSFRDMLKIPTPFEVPQTRLAKLKASARRCLSDALDYSSKEPTGNSSSRFVIKYLIPALSYFVDKTHNALPTEVAHND